LFLIYSFPIIANNIPIRGTT